MHKTAGARDPAAAFPLPSTRDDAQERRDANRAIAVSAIGLAATGIVELLLAIVTGSVGLLGDAIHNLSDVSTSAVVFLGFRLSRKGPTERYPYGLDRAEDLAGIGIAIVIWASAAFAGYEPSDPPELVTDRLRLAGLPIWPASKGSSREHTESDLRCYLAWCAERGLDPLAAQRPHLELHIRWMQQIRRFRPSTVVFPRFSVVAGFYRTCVIDGILEHSPSEYVR